MGSTYHSLHYHVVFSTKERRPFIRPEWSMLLYPYMGGVLRNLDGVLEAAGGAEDHVHLCISLNTTSVVADVVRELKKASSVWASENNERYFSWQEGYSVFSVSWTHVPVLRGYIAKQEEHHRKVSFIDELQRILEKNGTQYDPKFLL